MDAPGSSCASEPISEAKRQRDVLVRYGDAFRGIPHLESDPLADNELPGHHVPRLSKDASLTAFAQLACLRLGASRAMISLIDGERQHILAESTPEIFLRSDCNRDDASSSLWLGNVSIPRAAGVCEEVLRLTLTAPAAPEEAVVIGDLAQDHLYAQRSYVKGKPHLRFYAGVALTSPKGAVVGALCVFDDNPRKGLLKQEMLHLRDLSATIIEHLESYMVKAQNRRGEQLTRALLSFADGASAVRPFESETMTAEIPPSPNSDKFSVPADSKAPSTVGSSAGAYAWHGSLSTLQESILPAHSRTMFARAASVIRASSDLDGVLILDASVAGIASKRQRVGSARSPEDDLATSDGDTASRSSSHDDDDDGILTGQGEMKDSSTPGKTCQVLAIATSEIPGHARGNLTTHYRSFAEADLSRLLRAYPKGRIFDTTADGAVMSSAEDSDRCEADLPLPDHVPKRRPVSGGQERIAKAIKSLFPYARSTAFVPLWDYERSRWFAGCLCWSNRPDHQLSARVDLAYLKVFGHSIMRELSRLDALASDQAKTSFVASISHELRSPLHGILGTLEFLRDTTLDPFQASMLNSLEACGRTLLDTINHVLDYGKINETTKNVSSKRLKGTKGVHLSSKPLKRRKFVSGQSKHAAFDVALVTEEVVEAVFSAQSYINATNDAPDLRSDSGHTSSITPSLESTSGGARTRKDRFVVLDVANGQDWSHHLPIGSWRRIVMNLFGNALKYTESGHIHISLRSAVSADESESSCNIVLTVTDSGCGMSPQFLANRAFHPFSQENPLASGTGLGLSIVRQIIETIGGKIQIASDPKTGTEVQVKLASPPLERALRPQPQRTRFLEILDRLQGRRICILHKTNMPSVKAPDIVSNRESLKRFTTAIAKTMTEHLKMQVVHTEIWEGNDADLVICPEPSFDYLASIRQRRIFGNVAPVTIFVAMDSLEAATLRTDARVVNKESVVEIMTQPCGPYKLANVLNHCLNRSESSEENVWSPISTTQSQLPSRLKDSLVEHPFPRRLSSGSRSVQLESGGSPKELEKSISPTLTINTLSPPFALAEASNAEFTINDSMNLQLAHATPETLLANPMDELFTSEDLDAKQLQSPTQLWEAQFPGDSTPQTTGEKSFPSRMLITDDNAINRKLLVAFAQRHAIPYQEAENGLQALLTYQQAVDNPFDVILMDISMPVMDGMSATRAIREYEREQCLPRAYVIALTGLASSTARVEAWSSGVDHYVTKPVNFKALQKLFKKGME